MLPKECYSSCLTICFFSGFKALHHVPKTQAIQPKVLDLDLCTCSEFLLEFSKPSPIRPCHVTRWEQRSHSKLKSKRRLAMHSGLAHQFDIWIFFLALQETSKASAPTQHAQPVETWPLSVVLVGSSCHMLLFNISFAHTRQFLMISASPTC